ncbi:MAG TPA: hypothetical protein PLY38_05675 [Candidatus Hydrothermia bacterium]|nr:hypothetical protein [Candidatus Hydrothermia bacterium]
MKKYLIVFLLLTGFSAAKIVSFKYTSIGNMRLNVTNFGLFGTSFSRYVEPNTGLPYPSMEYPKFSRIERLYKGGLWIGVITPLGKCVTTGAVDETSVTPGSTQGFEFLPSSSISDSITEKSSIMISTYYAPDAISEQDLYCSYTDYRDFPTMPPEHIPIGVRIDQTVLVWSYPYIDDVVTVKFVIHNDGYAGDWDSLYIGFYGELASGSREFWGDDFGSTPYYQHKRLFYDDGGYMVFERNDGYDYLATGYGAYKFLGMYYNNTPVSFDTMTMSFNWWTWRDMRGTVPDSMRYKIMSNGERDPDMDDNYAYTRGYPDPIPLLSVGPISHLNIGDSVVLVIAFVGGNDLGTLLENASWAQKAFDANFILPAPPPSPHLVASPGNRKVKLYFDDIPEFARDPFPPNLRDFEGYRIYRGLSSFVDDTSWKLVAEFDKTPEDSVTDVDHSIGFNTGMPPKETEGQYAGYYTFEDVGVKNGFTYYYAVTSFDVGDTLLGLPSLESSKLLNMVKVVPGTPATEEGKVGVYPNPYKLSSVWEKGDARVIRFYNLPERCTIHILNASGDLVKVIKHDSPYGEEMWDLMTEGSQTAATGLYYLVVRNESTGDVEIAKFVIVR